MSTQFRLALKQPPSYAREAFIVAPCNAAAAAAVDAWPAWLGGALVLVGPAGSGKTHLAAAWAERAGALIASEGEIGDDVGALNRPMLLEDADRGSHDEALFHMINMAARPGGGLLLTARTPPSAWSAEVPDLRSRLNALPVAQLGEPDDAVLIGVLDKLFRERNIKPAEDLLSYLVRRIERSAGRAQQVVALLDEASDAHGRRVSRQLARQVLESETEPEGHLP